MSVKFSNNAVTTLSAGISVGATSFNVASASAFPTLASGDWTYVSLTSEVVKVTAISGTTFTCDATVNAHSSGESVELRMTSELLNDFAEDTEALPLAGGTMTGDVSLGDNVKAKFGAGNDLEIYHDGSNSVIRDTGAGDLRVQGNNLQLLSANGKKYLYGVQDAYTKLYYDNAQKLATTSTGIDVTGTVNGLEINTTATSNLGLGTGAVDSITTGGWNVGVGDSALTSCTEGSNNIAVGYSALSSNTTGNNNTASGRMALKLNTTGSWNTASGTNALYSNTTASNNTATGSQTLQSNTTGSNNTALGSTSLFNNTTGFSNTALGNSSLVFNTTGNNNTAIGADSLQFNTTGANNTASGYRALYKNTTGNYNVATGVNALVTNTTGANNTATGYEALKSNTTGAENTANGYQALYANTTGNYNTATGNNSMRQNSTGIYNVAYGQNSLYKNTTASNNTAVGSSALFWNTTGSYNTATGRDALNSNTTGANNSAFGYAAMRSNTTASYNTATGFESLKLNTTGASNTASGYQAMYYNTTGNDNTASGYQALKSNTTGIYNTASGFEALRSNTTGNYNTATGSNALTANTTGSENTATGYRSLWSNTTGSSNTANGYQALHYNTTGNQNVAVGQYALRANTTASYNTAIGYQSLYSNTTGFNNVANGHKALYYNTTGANNTALGYFAGDNITTGSSNIIIGYNVDAPSATASNQLNIGNWIKRDSAGAITLAHGTTTKLATTSTGIDVTGNVAVSGTVDGRDVATDGAELDGILAGSIGRINSPLLDLPLTNSLSMRSGVGSVTFARSTTATYVDRYGVLQTAPIDEPRFEKEGLLIEGVSTNYLPYSSDITHANWSNSGTTTTTLAPDGISLGQSVTGDPETIQSMAGLDTKTVVTISWHAKKNTTASSGVQIYESITSPSTVIHEISFNLDTKTLSSSAAFTNKKYEELANGWFRISATLTASVAFKASARWDYEWNASYDAYVWGAQVEELPFVSSYIPTTSSAVTRGQDVATVSYDNNMMSATQELTFIADMNVPSYNVSYSSSRGWFGIVGESYRYLRTADNVVNGSVAGAGLVAAFTISKALNSYCFTSNSTGIISYVDGASVSTGSAITIQRTGATSIALGETGHSSSTKLFGHIKNFKTYDTALTANEIKLLQGV